MDFTKKDARGAAEEAQFCHLRWPHGPQAGDYIMDEGKPVGVKVMGSMARSVQASLRDDARDKLQSAKGKNKSDQTRAFEDVQKDFVQSASRLTVEFVGIERDGKAAKVPDDCEWFYDLNMFSTTSLLSPKDEWQGESFAQQVLTFSNDAGNFLGNGSSG